MRNNSSSFFSTSGDSLLFFIKIFFFKRSGDGSETPGFNWKYLKDIGNYVHISYIFIFTIQHFQYSELQFRKPFFFKFKSGELYFSDITSLFRNRGLRSFFISYNFIFLPNECPGLCRHRPGYSLVKKIKLLEMKNEKNYSKASVNAFFWTKIKPR